MASTKVIKQITDSNFKQLSTYLPIILQEPIKNFHNSNISKDLTVKNFNGKLACGGSCYILHFILKSNNINTKMFKKKTYLDEYLHDHCYLMYKDIIIDPTYRQFFDKSIIKPNNYSKYLFETLPYTFVGTQKELGDVYNKLNNLHFNTYDSKLDFTLDDFWIGAEDISSIIDVDSVLSDENYAKKKGKNFLDFYHIFNQ